MKNKFQNKLYNYEATPAKKAWDKIAASLDESHLTDTFPKKLYNFQSKPPGGIWEKIETSLSDEKVIVIPDKRRNLAILRYAAAAILIGIFTITALWIINARKNDVPIANKNFTTPENVIAPDKTIEKAIITELTEDKVQQAQDDAALEASKLTYAKLDITPRERLMSLNPEYLTSPAEVMRNTDMLNPEETYRNIYYSCIHSTIHLEADRYNTTDRYVMLINPEGNIIRMAKKWGDLLCCVSGEEQDEPCKDQLKKWRDKLASAPVAHSNGNFLDILNLVNSLKDNH